MCACLVASALALMANLHEVNTKKHTERQPEGKREVEREGDREAEPAGQTAEADNERVSEVPATAVNYQ